MNNSLKTYYVLNKIILTTLRAKHIVNSLNDGTYYVNINFNICLHSNNLCQYIYIYIYNNLFELARERGMKVARACEPASARLSLQAMRLLQKQRFHLITEKYNVASQ